MGSSTPRLPDDRLAIGQLLVQLLYEFRRELFDAPARERHFPGVRFTHMAIWGNVGINGIRLTALAEHANLSLAACSEQVNELERLGYLERRPDPSDGRAKLIYPTRRGRQLLDRAGQSVAEIEHRWRQLCQPQRFDDACRTLDRLLHTLTTNDRTVTNPKSRARDQRSRPTGNPHA